MTVVVPENLAFSEMKLHRDPSETLRFNWEPLRRIAQANGHVQTLIDALAPDDIAAMIYQWYAVHRGSAGRRTRCTRIAWW